LSQDEEGSGRGSRRDEKVEGWKGKNGKGRGNWRGGVVRDENERV